jgi:hypothetical protein
LGIRTSRDHSAEPKRQRTDRCADGGPDDDRDEHAADAPNARERRPSAEQAAKQDDRHQHLEHVPARLAQSRPERERAVVVGKEVADEHAGQKRSPPRKRKDTPIPTGSQTIAANGARELEQVADFRARR